MSTHAIAALQTNPAALGDTLKQEDLAQSLIRISEKGPAGFYEGKTAELIAKEMAKNGGLITVEDLKAYRAKKRAPIQGTFRGYEIISMPPREGAFAQFVAMPDRNLVTVPDGVALEQAALAEPLAVSWHAARLALEAVSCCGAFCGPCDSFRLVVRGDIQDSAAECSMFSVRVPK